MAHRVKCYYCGKSFDRDKEPYEVVFGRRYAHAACAKAAEKDEFQEIKDKEELEAYILKLFNLEYLDPRIAKQIQKFRSEYNFTYSGMHKALIYFYEIKGNSIDKSNGGIGIIPYIYKRAHDYYYSLWLAQQTNAAKNVAEYIPEVKEITIANPERQVKKRKLFTFLDEEEN